MSSIADAVAAASCRHRVTRSCRYFARDGLVTHSLVRAEHLCTPVLVSPMSENLKESIVNKTLALLCGAALAAAATVTLAQTPPGTDRPGGDSGGQSAYPNMDKKGPMTKGTTGAGTGTPKAGVGNPTPPGTDRPGGDSEGQSAYPMPDKK